MKSCKGFTLIEVITSLMILTVCSLALLPILVKVYEERASIFEEQKAIFLLDQAITDWIYHDVYFTEKQLTENKVHYTLFLLEKDDNYLKGCIRWQGTNKRKYERCESGKR